MRRPTRPLSAKDWRAFMERLEGPKGCNFRRDGDDVASTKWRCPRTNRRPLARRALRALGHPPKKIEEVLAFCNETGGYCDCEILFNSNTAYQLKRRLTKAERRKAGKK